MNKVLDNIKAHLPYYVGGLLVLVNALVDGGYLNFPPNSVSLVNAVLAALGLGVLHSRQSKV